jgi:PilZ domain
MAENTNADDRPRNPRFSCGGVAEISVLPSNGLYLSGKILDLSLGGCRVDTPVPIERGARAEIVVHVNSASFRAVGEVKGIRGNSEAGIEFVYLSRGGKDLLADLVAELARLQAFINQLKAARRDAETESFRKQLESGKLLAAMWRERLRSLEGLAPAENSETDQVSSAGGGPNKEAQPLVAPVRLFR